MGGVKLTQHCLYSRGSALHDEISKYLLKLNAANAESPQSQQIAY